MSSASMCGDILRDPHYTIFWNENTGIETLVTELP